jgi:N-glycosylase/DNA lyase
MTVRTSEVRGGVQTRDGLFTRCRCCELKTWGQPWELGSAAFWAHLAGTQGPMSHRLARSFPGEVVACILGGAGVPGDVSTAAYLALEAAGLLAPGPRSPTAAEVADVLGLPLRVPGRARQIRYRFWRQRSERVAFALRWLKNIAGDPDVDPLSAPSPLVMRDRLMVLPGVGLKTASWVVRNYLDSDEVAIVDIHVARAGTAAGVFCKGWLLPRDYGLFESAFLRWARAGQVRASVLDAVIWRTMADLASDGDLLLGCRRTSVMLG